MKTLNTLRGCFFYIALAVTIIGLTVGLLLTKFFLPLRVRYEWICRPWAKLSLWLLNVICGIKVRNIGMENMPQDGRPCVVLAKHESAWDPFWLGAYLKNPPCFLYKRSLHLIPFLGWAIWSVNMLAVDRSNGRSAFENFMRRGPAILARGWWITLFPEGTRVPPGEHTPFKTGGARFACSTGAPILPIAHNAGDCWGKNSVAKTPGTITVVVGPLIETAGREPHDVNAEVAAWITRETARLHGLPDTH